MWEQKQPDSARFHLHQYQQSATAQSFVFIYMQSVIIKGEFTQITFWTALASWHFKDDILNKCSNFKYLYHSIGSFSVIQSLFIFYPPGNALEMHWPNQWLHVPEFPQTALSPSVLLGLGNKNILVMVKDILWFWIHANKLNMLGLVLQVTTAFF